MEDRTPDCSTNYSLREEDFRGKIRYLHQTHVVLSIKLIYLNFWPWNLPPHGVVGSHHPTTHPLKVLTLLHSVASG